MNDPMAMGQWMMGPSEPSVQVPVSKPQHHHRSKKRVPPPPQPPRIDKEVNDLSAYF